MVVEYDIRKIIDHLEELQARVDVLQANQRNAESGTTDCLAAGGGTNEGKPSRLAGREPCFLSDFIAYMKGRYESAKRLHEDDDLVDGEIWLERYKLAIKYAEDFMVTRRRTQDA